MKKRNESFVCRGCNYIVPIASKTCRNHCPMCFFSLHVDGDMPGDRMSTCHGDMIPIMYKRTNGSIKILLVCQSCQKEHWNKIAEDDNIGVLDASIVHWKSVYAIV